MTTDKDSRLVDYLYDEMTDEEADAFERALESDPSLSSDLDGLEETLHVLRSVEEEEPPAHLDALILASAREAAKALEEEAEQSGLRGWIRKMFGSPIAGLIGAASVALVAAIVMVPGMLAEKSAPADMEMEGIPAPAVVAKQEARETMLAEESQAPRPAQDLVPPAEPEPTPAPKLEPKGKREEKAVRFNRPKRRTRTARRAPVKRLKKKTAPKPAPMKQQRPATGLDDAQAGGDSPYGDPPRGAAKKLGPAQPPAPPKPAAPRPVATGEVAEAEDAPAMTASDQGLRAERTETRSDRDEADDQKDREQAAKERMAAKEEQGRAMLAAARQEFARKNPTSGRRILVRALAVSRGAPVHAEIAFRLAQHDYDRGAYREAVRYGRIAASAPRFDKRSAALDLVVAAEEKLREQQVPMDRNLAPAAQPDTDVAR